jgi:hypothetical protein
MTSFAAALRAALDNVAKDPNNNGVTQRNPNGFRGNKDYRSRMACIITEYSTPQNLAQLSAELSELRAKNATRFQREWGRVRSGWKDPHSVFSRHVAEAASSANPNDDFIDVANESVSQPNVFNGNNDNTLVRFAP